MSEQVDAPEGVVAPVDPELKPTEAPDGEPKVEAEKPADPPKPESKSDDEPKGVAKRIKELTDRIRAAEQREAAYLRMLEQRQGGEPPKPAEPDKPKSLKDFNYDENAYRDYLYAEARSQAAQAAKEEAAKWRQEQEAIGRRAKFDERASRFAATNPDYNEVIEGRWECSQAMAEVIEDSEEGPAIAYHLAQNPDVAARIARLGPTAAARELTRIEDRLVAERKKAVSVSKAPPPAPKIDAVDPAPKVTSTSDPKSDELSDEEWFRLAEKERQKKRKG